MLPQYDDVVTRHCKAPTWHFLPAQRGPRVRVSPPTANGCSTGATVPRTGCRPVDQFDNVRAQRAPGPRWARQATRPVPLSAIRAPFVRARRRPPFRHRGGHRPLDRPRLRSGPARRCSVDSRLSRHPGDRRTRWESTVTLWRSMRLPGCDPYQQRSTGPGSRSARRHGQDG